MAVTEVLRALGGWEISLKDSTPRYIWDEIKYFGHIAIHSGNVDVGVAGDSLLRSARYVGVLTKQNRSEGYEIGGYGMAFWLGDSENKGDIREALFSVTNEPFHTLIPQLLPASGAVIPGTIFNIGGAPFSGSFQYQTPRQEIDYVAETMGAAWRVNGDGTLDAGLESQLFRTDPVAAVFRRNTGVDMKLRGLLGEAATDQDVEDFSTRVVLLANGDSGAIAIGDADINPVLNTYKDIHGNAVKITRLVTETEPSSGVNADARAQLQLNRFTGTRDALDLSTPEYDIKGDLSVGDSVWVWDPELGLENPANEIIFFGMRLNPLKLRLTQMTWPVAAGMSVAYRNDVGKWFDLTDYLEPEGGSTTLVVGDYSRSLSGEGDGGPFPVTPPSGPNTSIPDAPEWVEPFFQSTYQSPINGDNRAQVLLEWLQPANTDSSTIVDGQNYEIRYRTATTPLFPVTHNQMAAFTHQQLKDNGGTFGQPIQYAGTDWTLAYVPFDQLDFTINELTPNMPYEAQIRAVDNGEPPNYGAWSDLVTWQTINDTIAPSQPAPPLVAASTLAIQVLHTLGRQSGGEYNLDRDLHHLEVHGGTEPLFPPTESTLLGKMPANWAMLDGEVAVVNTFPIKEILPVFFKVIAVDTAGNRSMPSIAVSATADLVDNAHISNLSVSKLIAGTITSSFIHAGWMRIGGGAAGSGLGPAIELTPGSIQAISPTHSLVLDFLASTGVMRVFGTGGVQIRGPGGLQVTGGGNVEITDGRLNIKNAAGQTIVEVGECSDGRHGVLVKKDTGVQVARMGELAAGGHGIEVIDEVTGALVKVSTLAFGVQAAYIGTAQFLNGTGGAYADLATAGPSVTVTIGNSGRAIVFVSCGINPQVPGQAYASFAVTGATSVSPTAGRSVGFLGTATFTPSETIGAAFVLSGLNPGTHAFTMKYSTTGAGANACLFFERNIAVFPY